MKKKILMRAPMSPLDNFEPAKVLSQNLIGNNIGNLLFPHSLFRTLMTENIEIDTLKFSTVGNHYRRINAAAERIENQYDQLVLPFANAFRVSFMSELRCITSIVKKVSVPCIVTGVGFQAPLDKNLSNPELDRAVYRFMVAVLDKSNCVGVRGERTADYLKKLGFCPERDYTVIGCPSMFLYGKELPMPNCQELKTTSKVSFNSKISLPQNFHDFLARSYEAFEHAYYIPQVIEEIYRMYAGMPFPEKFVKTVPKGFPADFSHLIYKKNRARSFINVYSWLNFLKKMEFSFGSRIHGNIAAILAGTPAYVFVSDQRILELVDYHQIPHSMIGDITEKTSIFEVYEKADFTSVLEGHERRFLHYLDFLRKNGLETIYDQEGNPGHVYFDDACQQKKFLPPICSFSAISVEKQVKRLDKVYRALRKK